MGNYHGASAWRAAGTRPGRTQLRRRGAQSVVGRRHNLHPDLGRVSLPGGGARHLQPQNRRLGDGNPSAHRTDNSKAFAMRSYLDGPFWHVGESENVSIPGQMAPAELDRLARLARSVLPNGCIVEVGSLFG